MLAALHLKRHFPRRIEVVRCRSEEGVVGGKVKKQIVHFVLTMGAQYNLLQINLNKTIGNALLLLPHPLNKTHHHPPPQKARHHQDAERKDEKELSRGKPHRTNHLEKIHLKAKRTGTTKTASTFLPFVVAGVHLPGSAITARTASASSRALPAVFWI